MADSATWSEKRRALRVPLRGVAVFHAGDGAMHGMIENVSTTGALVSVAGLPFDDAVDVELKLGDDTGWVSARTVRIERTARRWRVAVQFDGVSSKLRAAIDQAIDNALRAALSRPVLIVDDRTPRRIDLEQRLEARGMTPLIARTPLDAIDALTRAQLHVNVCLLAPSFGHSCVDLRTLMSESFPWVTTTDICDDVDATADRALEAWSGTDVARIADAIA